MFLLHSVAQDKLVVFFFIVFCQTIAVADNKPNKIVFLCMSFHQTTSLLLIFYIQTKMSKIIHLT